VTQPDPPLSRTAASQAVAATGWRYLLGTLCASIPVGSLRGAAQVAAAAVLGYADEPTHHGATDAIVDPVGQLPAVWFQQMDAPRPERNRMHVDITVAHDEAEARLAAALAAGGRLVRDAEAPAFWVAADPEGNEVCICTWQNRDERGV